MARSALRSSEMIPTWTHMDQYWTSAVTDHRNTRGGVVRILMNRVDRLVSDETELWREKEHIRKALQVNGYLDWILTDGLTGVWSVGPRTGRVGGGEKGGREERCGVESASYHHSTWSWRSTCISGQEVSSGAAIFQGDRWAVEEGVLILWHTAYFTPINILCQLLIPKTR